MLSLMKKQASRPANVESLAPGELRVAACAVLLACSTALGQSITIVAPNGGENWKRGSTYEIKWTSSGMSGENVKLTLYDGSLPITPTITDSTVNDGSYFWTIPADGVLGSTFRIRIAGIVSGTFDYSDSYFSLASVSNCAYAIVAPNGGEAWARGTTHTITWTPSECPDSDVKLTLYDGSVPAEAITGSTPNDGNYSWTIPCDGAIGSNFRIRIQGLTSCAYDYSNSYFTLTSGYVPPTITVPAGGESWPRCTTHTIMWTPTCAVIDSMVRLDLCQGGQPVETIVSSTPNDGSYSWTIPCMGPVGIATIRITGLTGGGFDDSPPLLITQDPKPDLAIMNCGMQPPDPMPGSTVRFTATICNLGNANAGPFVVAFFVDSLAVGNSVCSGLGAGACTQCWFTYAFPSTGVSGTHTVRIVVDPYNQIDESNEVNNECSFVIIIPPPPASVIVSLSRPWMYQNLVGQAGCRITGTAAVTNDPMGNSSYTYQWAIVPPADVTAPPTLQSNGASCTAIAGDVSTGGSVSNSGGSFTLRVTVTGNQYGNTGTAQVSFGVCLLGDVNNDTVVNAADRSIVNAFWQTGAAGSYTLYDSDVNGDGVVNAADRSIVNAVWRGTLGGNSVGTKCPNR